MKSNEVALLSATILSGIIANKGFLNTAGDVATSVKLAREILDLVNEPELPPGVAMQNEPGQALDEITLDEPVAPPIEAAPDCDTKKTILSLAAAKPDLTVIERQPAQRPQGPHRNQRR